jgi:hypothetical protein
MSEIANGCRSITAETALRLARYLTLVRDASRPDRSDTPAPASARFRRLPGAAVETIENRAERRRMIAFRVT